MFFDLYTFNSSGCRKVILLEELALLSEPYDLKFQLPKGLNTASVLSVELTATANVLTIWWTFNTA